MRQRKMTKCRSSIAPKFIVSIQRRGGEITIELENAAQRTQLTHCYDKSIKIYTRVFFYYYFTVKTS